MAQPTPEPHDQHRYDVRRGATIDAVPATRQAATTVDLEGPRAWHRPALSTPKAMDRRGGVARVGAGGQPGAQAEPGDGPSAPEEPPSLRGPQKRAAPVGAVNERARCATEFRCRWRTG
ncbi:hypothetical protein [Streptomyces sp. NPDC058629]|uniref:hypothetical protein n=1 Tax=Streptomyces sp. NPDC058629 TaxID=3346565 RepID=UPI003664B102